MSDTEPRILDVGCGKRKHPGAIGIDDRENTAADVVHDLNAFPYPFADSEFDLILIRHTLEHLDNVIRVMEEVHRIAKPGAKVCIDAPYFTSVDAFSDITHKHFFTSRSFDYFTDDIPSLDFYSSARFKKLKVKILFFAPRRAGWIRPQNWLGLGILAKKCTKFYEVFLAHIFPARAIHYELEVLK